MARASGWPSGTASAASGAGANSIWAVDPGSGENLACELTSNDEGDASQVGPLLEQIPGPIASVIADGAYDGEPVYRAVAERQSDPPAAVIVPPRATAVPSAAAGTAPSQRDRHVQLIRDKGRMGWQKAVDYGRRSLGETAISRYKVLIGPSLRARTLPAQSLFESRHLAAALRRERAVEEPFSQLEAAPTGRRLDRPLIHII